MPCGVVSRTPEVHRSWVSALHRSPEELHHLRAVSAPLPPLVGRFGPRWPGRRTSPLSRTFTAAAPLGSYGHRGHLPWSGAAAMAAAICSLLNVEGLRSRRAFHACHRNDRKLPGAVICFWSHTRKTNAVATPNLQALFAVLFAFVFHCDHRGVKTQATSQIYAVIPEDSSLCACFSSQVNHGLIVDTANYPRQTFRNRWPNPSFHWTLRIKPRRGR